MQIFVKFEGIIDHLDILSEESKKSLQLINTLQLALKEVPKENVEQILRVNEILRHVEAFQRTIFRRKNLLLEIVSILKNASIKTDNVVTEIEYMIEKVSNGGQGE